MTAGKCLGLRVKWSSGNKIPRHIMGYASGFLGDLYGISVQVLSSPDELPKRVVWKEQRATLRYETWAAVLHFCKLQDIPLQCFLSSILGTSTAVKDNLLCLLQLLRCLSEVPKHAP